jgi:hypothetical protein
MNSTITPDDIFQWYAQFSYPEAMLDWASEKRNLFFKVSQTRIERFESEFGNLIPHDYRRFLIEVGEGRFTEDVFGTTTDTYANIFAGPETIAGLFKSYEHLLRVNPTMFKLGEVPFFDIGSADYIVFDKNDASCKFSFLKEQVAKTFLEFLLELRQNVTFYLDVK